MAQARAFVSLRLMDRATLRLEKLAEIDACERESLMLLAKCFLMRGWPKRAAAPLKRLLIHDPSDNTVIAMLEATTQEPMRPDSALETSDDPADLVGLAEEHIAAGEFLKAQKIIERARRIRPNNPHAADLLWGMAGDYKTEEPLNLLVEQWGPDTQTLADLPEYADHTEHTESVSAVNLARNLDPPDPKDSKAFHRLFKGLDDLTESFTDTMSAEVTQTAAMANVHDLSAFPESSPDAPTTINDGEDTQIAMVLRPEGPSAELTEVGRRPNATPVGLAPLAGRPRRPVSDFDPGLEEEDDDLIILTGRERTDNTAWSVGLGAGLPLDPDPTTSDVSGRVAEILEQVEREKAREALNELPPPNPKAPKKKKRRTPPTGTAAWWLFAIGAVLFASAMVIFALAFLQFILG